MSAQILLILRIAIIVGLYIFLAWALYILWCGLKQQAEELSTTETTSITLLEITDTGQLEHKYTKPEVIIGRDPSCDYSLKNKTVSNQHARLSYRQNQWWLEDLGSTNRTYLNDEEISSPTIIADQDKLRCGEARFEIRISSGIS
jgi:pSer/pThr/pTyr-binding forkhead associated (FHA) protein